MAASAPLHQREIEIDDPAVDEFYQLVEGHFDELGLTEADRDERYTRLEAKLDAQDAENARA